MSAKRSQDNITEEEGDMVNYESMPARSSVKTNHNTIRTSANFYHAKQLEEAARRPGSAGVIFPKPKKALGKRK